MSKTHNAGIVTAYGAAVRGGYTGTYEDFCRQQAEYAENTAAVEQAKNTAVSAANTATTKAREAAVNAAAAQGALAGMTFVAFTVSPDGHVMISNSDLLGTTSFELTDNGHMEVTY